jgi:hypothetical protein
VAAINDILTESERRFLSWYGLGPEDVFDARGMSTWLWRQRIREEAKTIALGTTCKNGGHRLRTRSGHCVQCDPKKLAFQARHSADQHVYIAGSLTTKLIKIGTCKYIWQRESQLRAEGYGGASDWNVIFSIKVKNAGDIEHRARSRISQYVIARPYWKDGVQQSGTELLRCSFRQAKKALLTAAEGSELGEPWNASFTYQYEFNEST